jgi:hypothetical protein
MVLLDTHTLSHFQVQSPYPDRLEQRYLINSSRRELQLLARTQPRGDDDSGRSFNDTMGLLHSNYPLIRFRHITDMTLMPRAASRKGQMRSLRSMINSKLISLTL